MDRIVRRAQRPLVDRILGRAPEGPAIRIWTPPHAPDGVSDGVSIVIEWCHGQPGHPSTYGLLGGKLGSGATTFLVPEDRPQFRQACKDLVNRAVFGLPREYRAEILRVVPDSVVITAAAAGETTSSQLVFRVLARVLMSFLRDGVPEEDAQVRAAFRGSWREAVHLDQGIPF
jgi:hypothetical protein